MIYELNPNLILFRLGEYVPCCLLPHCVKPLAASRVMKLSYFIKIMLREPFETLTVTKGLAMAIPLSESNFLAKK